MTAFSDHFSAAAEGYAAHRPRYPRELAWWLGEVAPARGVAWEAGCGSGQLSTLLGDVFARVEATDASEAQLAHAPPHPHVHYRVAPAEACGLPDAAVCGGVHLAVAAQAVHWFDLPKYYAEVRRVLCPGGAVALVAYGLAEISHAVDEVVRRFYSDVVGPYWPPERGHIMTGYRDLDFPFEPLDVPELVMQAEWRLEDLLGYVDTWSAMRGYEKAKGADAADLARRELAGKLGQVWGAAGSTRAVKWPLVIRAGRA